MGLRNVEFLNAFIIDGDAVRVQNITNRIEEGSFYYPIWRIVKVKTVRK